MRRWSICPALSLLQISREALPVSSTTRLCCSGSAGRSCDDPAPISGFMVANPGLSMAWRCGTALCRCIESLGITVTTGDTYDWCAATCEADSSRHEPFSELALLPRCPIDAADRQLVTTQGFTILRYNSCSMTSSTNPRSRFAITKSRVAPAIPGLPST